ncbi:type II toxin-antitoxin system HipA family toxin [Kribbella sp. NPDC050241]|uniref:type II toxin-antitoxin system HipA family toxin n=1 Tax=Kribbella sp. NPDC050241 TaxID=3364115 RepID=UPI0037A1B854
MAEDRLVVYLDGIQTGILHQSQQGRLTFEYDDNYRVDPRTPPLSLSMPKAAQAHPNKPARAFVSGLLPDSEAALQRLGRKYGVSPNNPFALLRHIGRDAAGAVQILPEDVASHDAANRQGDIEWLSDDALDKTLAELAQSPDAWDPGRNTGRWSLAGAQSKVALFRSPEGRWGVPHDSTPTTHILKPSMPNYQGHHLNEHLCLRAAQLCDLPAASTELLAGDRYEVLISHRYDRVLDSEGRWKRLHQEDMCQALAVPPIKKYQEDGGPGIRQIGDLLTRSSLSVSRRENLRRMFDYIVYNVAIGATDAHAKNFSVLLGSRDIRLAPLYDVATMLPYDQERGLKSAMRIGDTWDMAAVTDQDWAITGRRLGLSPDESVSRARAIKERIPAAFDHAVSEDKIPDSLRSRARWIAELITAHLRNRRNRWGSLDVAPWTGPATT